MQCPTTPNNRVAAARRIADKKRRDAFNQNIARIGPEYVAKLRHDCLRAANERLRGADPPRPA